MRLPRRHRGSPSQGEKPQRMVAPPRFTGLLLPQAPRDTAFALLFSLLLLPSNWIFMHLKHYEQVGSTSQLCFGVLVGAFFHKEEGRASQTPSCMRCQSSLPAPPDDAGIRGAANPWCPVLHGIWPPGTKGSSEMLCPGLQASRWAPRSGTKLRDAPGRVWQELSKPENILALKTLQQPPISGHLWVPFHPLAGQVSEGQRVGSCLLCYRRNRKGFAPCLVFISSNSRWQVHNRLLGT